MTIKTNHHLRPLRSWHDLPADICPDFDYVRGDDRYDDRFFDYRGAWYDTGDAERVDQPHLGESPFVGWDAFFGESAFSAVLFRFPTDDEVFRHDLYSDRHGYVVVGYYFD